MKRSRPKQHYRRIKTKRGRKRILINKGVKKRNYGFVFKSTDFKALSKVPDPDHIDTMKYINWGKAFPEMRNKGVRLSSQKEDMIKNQLDDGNYLAAWENLPDKVKMTINLSKGRSAENILGRDVDITPKVIKPLRLKPKPITIPLQKTKLLQQGDEHMAQYSLTKDPEHLDKAKKAYADAAGIE